jgi:hypothetical protein
MVHAGTRRDAVLFAVRANQAHGLRRTNDDKRRAVMTLLNDEEWGKWSNREIARRCAVHPSLVDGMRGASLPVSGSEKPHRTYTTKHGTEATMNTEKIGRKISAAAAQREDRLVREGAAIVGASSGGTHEGERLFDADRGADRRRLGQHGGNRNATSGS